jgi:hypothetical protein
VGVSRVFFFLVTLFLLRNPSTQETFSRKFSSSFVAFCDIRLPHTALLQFVNHSPSTIVLQSVFVMNLFASLLPLPTHSGCSRISCSPLEKPSPRTFEPLFHRLCSLPTFLNNEHHVQVNCVCAGGQHAGTVLRVAAKPIIDLESGVYALRVLDEEPTPLASANVSASSSSSAAAAAASGGPTSPSVFRLFFHLFRILTSCDSRVGFQSQKKRTMVYRRYHWSRHDDVRIPFVPPTHLNSDRSRSHALD